MKRSAFRRAWYDGEWNGGSSQNTCIYWCHSRNSDDSALFGFALNN